MLPLSSILEKINPLDKGTSADEYCLSLIIGDKKVKSAIWNLSGSSDFLVLGDFKEWGNDSAEELIVAADASIADAITKLPNPGGKQPTKVMLGLPEHWGDGNGVSPRKGLILQKVCQKLLLKSLGFVVTPEAIAHFLRIEEGGLPSAILINLSETEIIVSLINNGKFFGSKLVGRSDNLSLDLEEGLLRFDHQGVLPNRILLLIDGELTTSIEELKQNLVAYPWIGPENEKKLNFLQLPKIEVAGEDFETRAVVIAGRHELGLEDIKEKKVIKEEVKEEIEAAPPPVEEVFTEESLEDFGFVKDKDILLGEALIEETEKSPVIETEVIKLTPPPRKFLSTIFTKLKSFIKIRPFPALVRPRLNFAFNKAIFLFIFGILFALGLGFFSFYRLAKAEVTIFVQPQKIEKEFQFTASAKTGTVDGEKMTVPVREIPIDVSGNKTVNINGKKTVGDKATGEITVYNRSDQVKTIPKGSMLKGPANLRFVLQEEVKVASKTADLQQGIDKWGEVKASVAAENIGAQYNLAALSNLVFEQISQATIIVKNQNAFANGSSREIQAVSKEDRENLLQSLLSELEKKANEGITGKLTPGDYLLPDSLKLTGKIDQFNHEVNDEAATLTLDEKATFTVSYLKEEDFKVLADKNISQLIPEGYQKEPTKEESNFTLQDKVKGAYTAKVTGEFIPVLGTGEIPQKLTAKTIANGEKLLRSLNQVADVNINIKPSIFSFLKIFPIRQQNITVVVETL